MFTIMACQNKWLKWFLITSILAQEDSVWKELFDHESITEQL